MSRKAKQNIQSLHSSPMAVWRINNENAIEILGTTSQMRSQTSQTSV